MQIKLSIPGDQRRKLEATLKRLQVVARGRVAAAVVEAGMNIERRAKQNVPVDTGRLKTSITRIESADRLGVVVGTNVEYALFVEYGTGPAGAGTIGSVPLPPGYRHGPAYVIRPRHKKVLAWKTPGGGWIIARRVVHPGVKARPFLYPAAQAERDDFIKAIREALRTAADQAKT